MKIEVALPFRPEWEQVTARRLFDRARREPHEDDGIVTAFRDGQVTLRSNRRVEGFTNAVQEIGYQGVRVGDLVIHSMDGFAGAIGVSDSDGKSSPVVHCFVPHGGTDCRYYAYLLRVLAQRGFITSLAKGIRERSTAFDVEAFRSLVLPHPPLAEQRAIADYLDAETVRIDALIAKKQQLIHLLEERWAATLTTAFDCPSGLRLKHLLGAPMAYGVLVPDHVPDGPMMLRISDFRHGDPDPALVARISETLHNQYRRTIVQEGDLVVSVVGTLGRAAIVARRFARANLNRPLARVQLRHDVPVDLIRMWCGSSQFAHQAELVTGTDSAQPTLNLGDLKNFRVGLPLAPSAWGPIRQRLQRAEASWEQTQGAVTRQLHLLAEHRQALITAAVTGEFAVPGAE